MADHQFPGRRRSVIAFLAMGLLLVTNSGLAKPLKLEKEQIRIGFIKLTDMVPLAVAYEKGYFEDEGLYVTLEPQANWKVALDRVITGELDASHMLAGQPLGATIGIGTRADIITAFSMDLNGNAVTVSNAVWQQMQVQLPRDAQGKLVRPVKADALKPVVESFRAAGKPFRMGVVFPVSTHNYELRYWLASGGLHPGFYSPSDVTGQIRADVQISVTPPPQMPATMEAGTINGYCVGEPWNQQAIFKKVGVPVITDYEIWKNNPEKVIGVTRAWAEKNPNTHLAMIKALLRAAAWLDASPANRKEAAAMISQSQYVGADVRVISNSMTGTFEYVPGEKRAVPDFNVFYRYYATYPFYSDAIWYLTQMRRWGQIPEGKPDSWYLETARKVYRPDIYLQAAKLLLEEGKLKKEDVPWDTDGFKPPTKDFIDGMAYDGHKPNAYIDGFAIGLKGQQKVEGGMSQGSNAVRSQPDTTPATAPAPAVASHREPAVRSVIARRTVRTPERLCRVLNLLGLGWIVPIIRIAGGEEPRTQLRDLWRMLGVPLVAMIVFVLMWSYVAGRIHTSLGQIPGPVAVWTQAEALWADHKAERAKAAAFYQRQELRNVERRAADPGAEITVRRYTGRPTYIDQILTSLKTVFTGFLFATLLAVPIGILCGMSRTMNAAVNPFIQVFKPISPLAWLPLVTLIVSAAYVSESPMFEKSFLVSAITVALCSLWPTVINTSQGVASIDRDLLNVAKVLRLNWRTRLTKLVLPSALPLIFTGMRLSLGVGWMVLIAAEMLAQNPGLGKFVWDEFQNGSADSMSRMLVAVFTIGFIGFLLDRVMLTLQSLTDFSARR